MKALILGAGGQLGLDLVTAAPSDFEIAALDRRALDITDQELVHRFVADARPDVILNAAAYTAVDRAEQERDLAWSINGDAVGYLARRAVEVDAHLIHISTDFVFDGTATEPYSPDATTNPTSEYGASKLEGESQALQSNAVTIVRSSRLYSGSGNNFVTTMLRLMGSRDELSVIDDQVGSPTWSKNLADSLWRFAARSDLTGIWHWTDAGSCSWYEWAVAIQRQAMELDLLDRMVPIEPVSTSDFPTAATRPAYSVLDSSATCTALAIGQVPWKAALDSMLGQMANPDTP